MNILIVGCGRVGSSMVRLLEEMEHQVSVLDIDPKAFEQFHQMDGYQFSGVAITGIPIDTDVLRQAGIETCDAVAVATSDDKVNIMVAQMASELFGVPRVIARCTDPVLKQLYSREFGLRTVCATNLTVQSMLLSLLGDEASYTVTIGSTTAAFVTVAVSEWDVGRPLNQVSVPPNNLLYGVLRSTGIMELATQPMPILQEGDQIVFSRISD
ncbi:MAG: TrkA family potassium uptake protein [Candidatus Fournierella pullistercoris]|uniref:TrkA family potassium uptake protein n=1 Tax=Candidatus Allofournierella pullistercoris TaxID=2838597 RepID=A0A948T1N6_9FIRM|nr:TrkA family potassium uptake protein [Candidatus Fournierella pullistercoris]